MLAERSLLQVQHLTETDIGGWFTFLQQKRTPAGKRLAARTIETYARSVQAFCHWLVCRGYLKRTPLVEVPLPHADPAVLPLLYLEEFEQVVLACQPPKTQGPQVERAAARNRAILWVFFDIGISVSELCTLRLLLSRFRGP